MQRKTVMKQKIKLLIVIALVALLTLAMSGCDKGGYDIDGMNVVTFEMQGGMLEYGTSSTDTKINFAYHPGTYILDPTTIPNYSLMRQDYNFTGWYTTPECNAADKWDFSTPFNTQTLTLYAGWEKAIKFTYTVYFVDGEGASVSLGQYEVKTGDTFSDWREFAKGRDGYTPMGYYSDITLETEWDYSTTHPGGDADLDIPVYVDYIVGEWALVNDFASLRDAIKKGENVYLQSDIDCGGEMLIDPLLVSVYSGIFEGNNYTVSNFVCTNSSGAIRPSIAIFKSLGAGAEIKNVSFTDVSFNLGDVRSTVTTVKAAALAVEAANVTIKNVSVSATLTTNYTGELSKLQSAVYEENGVTQEGFSANVTLNITN